MIQKWSLGTRVAIRKTWYGDFYFILFNQSLLYGSKM